MQAGLVFLLLFMGTVIFLDISSCSRIWREKSALPPRNGTTRSLHPGPHRGRPGDPAGMSRPVIGTAGPDAGLSAIWRRGCAPFSGTRAHDIFLTACSATGFWRRRWKLRGARVVVPVCGAFSERVYDVALACGIEAGSPGRRMGESVPARGLPDMLATGRYDAVALFHNEPPRAW